MTVLGIETSCDECAAAVVDDGTLVRSNVVASQIEYHRPFYGVVPEIASRRHVESIGPVVQDALAEASTTLDGIDAVAVTHRPGLVGSLLVGVSFAKGLAAARELPLIGVDHIEAHLYSPHLEADIRYPYIGMLLSGGHTMITRVERWDRIEVLGTTIDDACGEAFDKVAKFFDFGFPGGVAIDRLAREGNATAYRFPVPNLHKGDHRYDVSYSGLKTAVIHQREQFRRSDGTETPENIAASFQRAAIDIIIDKALMACRDTGTPRLVAAGGVAANSYLRDRLTSEEIEVHFPSLALCTDNAAMIAGLGYHRLEAGERSDSTLNASARVPAFKRGYP